MKNLILLLTVGGFALQTQAQELMVKDVPEAVIGAFDSTNSLIRQVDWTKDGCNFVAEFDAGKVETSITYDVTGKVVEIKKQIPVDSLPIGVVEYMNINYKDSVVKEASKITDALGVVTYETEMNGKYLIFDAKGLYIKFEEELVLFE